MGKFYKVCGESEDLKYLRVNHFVLFRYLYYSFDCQAIKIQYTFSDIETKPQYVLYYFIKMKGCFCYACDL